MSKIEVASTGRASCKACRKKIDKGELRFGEEVMSMGFDGNMTLWFHLSCAAAQRPEQLKPVLKKYKKPIPDRAAIEAGLDGKVARSRMSKLLFADVAPTSRAKCQECKLTIEKDTIRVGLMLDSVTTMPGTGFLHLVCAPVYAQADVAKHLAGKTKKLEKASKARMSAILKSAELLDREARGQQLEGDARKVLKQKNPSELSVLGDWLEEQGARVDKDELLQMLKVRQKRA